MTPSQSVTTTFPDNQPGPLPDLNLYETDRPLQKAMAREGGAWAADKLRQFGALMGQQATLALANDANRFPPELAAREVSGEKFNLVEYHPAYHRLMNIALSNGLHSVAWLPSSGSHVVHTALEYLFAQIEGGVCCPVTMTYAAVPLLKLDASLEASELPKLLIDDYDQRFAPTETKRAITVGMALTEKQGGSDLRSNRTTATALEAGWHQLEGHKWFCSAPMSDGFFTLARADEGLSCFWLPRWRPDGKPNPFVIRKLKDKLGNRSNASAEIEYHNTWAKLIGEPGRGIATIMTMVKHTRLDTCLAPVALMRQSFLRALYHVQHRRAFGRLLIDHPLMQSVFADLGLELEAAVMLLFRIARSFDENSDGQTNAFSRMASGIGKFYLNKLAPGFVCETLEALGGNGYVEDHLLARLYREAPLNGIWEGSGNVICLDVLDTLARHPGCVEQLFQEFREAEGEHPLLDDAIRHLGKTLSQIRPEATNAPGMARYLVQRLATLWQAVMLLKHGQPSLAAHFCKTRLQETRGAIYGSFRDAAEAKAILAALQFPELTLD